jgi:flagellar FliJ protein
MKKFKFRLETLLKVRKIELEKQAKILALIHQEIAKGHQDLARLRQLQIDEVKRVKELTHRGSFQQAMLMQSIQYRDDLKRQEGRKIKEIQDLMRKADKELAKLVEKEKRKKILDKLEERDRENYEDETKKMELKEMDEVASTRWFSSE